MQSIAWDAGLAARMQQWANTCPGFQHGGPAGFQNMAPFTPCNSDAACAKDPGAAWMWYDNEETKWNFATNSSSTTWVDCGHFSNMMGPKVTSMGCGYSTCNGQNADVVWCNYNNAEQNPVVPHANVDKQALKTKLSGGNQQVAAADESEPAHIHGFRLRA